MYMSAPTFTTTDNSKIKKEEGQTPIRADIGLQDSPLMSKLQMRAQGIVSARQSTS
jgi:hypothetical protein